MCSIVVLTCQVWIAYQAGSRKGKETWREWEVKKPSNPYRILFCYFSFLSLHPHPFANYSVLQREVCGSRGSMFNWPVGLTECCCIDETERCVACTLGKLRLGMTMTTLGAGLNWLASHSQDNYQLACFTGSLECRTRLPWAPIYMPRQFLLQRQFFKSPSQLLTLNFLFCCVSFMVCKLEDCVMSYT